MNLSKLFEMQAALDTHIEHEHPRLESENRLDKKVLALLVELGELANEWRGFKFWSNNQKANTEQIIYKLCTSCEGEYVDTCWVCGHSGQVEDKTINPLLEEYVDCLHFALSIGNEMFAAGHDFNLSNILDTSELTDEYITVESTFRVLFSYANEIHLENPLVYENLLTILLNLGFQLGFTQEQIEQAYNKKNEVNHQRQLTGY